MEQYYDITHWHFAGTKIKKIEFRIKSEFLDLPGVSRRKSIAICCYLHIMGMAR